jgi:hypothetical protein
MQLAPVPFGEGGERRLVTRDRRAHRLLLRAFHRQP